MGRSYVTFAEFITATRDVIDSAPAWAVGAAALAGVAGLVVLTRRLRHWGRRNAANKVTAVATLLGLGWSAQGMWDTAVHRYEQAITVASVLFIVFEAMMVSKMLRAHEYRTDRRRRAKAVRAVWVIAVVMACVVALGEGWEQAPARLAVPILVAYGWWSDLVADDDPAERMETERRWTMREIGLRIGWLKVRDTDVRDASEAERRQLTLRMARLAFAERFGDPRVSALLRRRIRLARLRLLADDAQIAEVDDRLARAEGKERAEVDPTPTPEPPPSKPPTKRRSGHPTGTAVRTVEGEVLVGEDLKRDVIKRLLTSATPDRPLGMRNQDLCNSYAPPLALRTVEGWVSGARQTLRDRRAAGVGHVNGRSPDLTVVP